MNVEFLKDGTNFWACVRNSCTVTIQMKPLLLDWWKKSRSVMVSEIKLFGGTFFSQHFYNNIYKWDLEISVSTSGVKAHYSFSVCVVNYMSTKKNIKNTTCIKTVIFASCGTFIGNSVPSSPFIMHFLLTCITIIKTTVLITCVLLILMFMLMLQHWSVASLNSRFLPEWRIENKLLRIALWIEPHKTRQNTKDSPMTDFSIILHVH